MSMRSSRRAFRKAVFVAKRLIRVLPQSVWVLALLGGICTGAQSTSPVSPTPESWRQSTQNISELDKTDQKDVVRQERSAAFNDKRSDASKLDAFEANNGLTYQSAPPYFSKVPAIPVRESNAVVVATVTAVQPYFSSDHAHLYTEFSLTVDEEIKDIPGRAKVGETIPIVIRGGKMRLADGRVIQEQTAFTNFSIAVGSRYLLFLAYHTSGQYFTVVKSWELKNGGIIPTAREDQMDAREGKSQYSAMTESNLICAAYTAAKTDKDE